MGKYDFRSLKKGKNSTPLAFVGDPQEKMVVFAPKSSTSQQTPEASSVPQLKRGREVSSQASLSESPSKCPAMLVDFDSSSPLPAATSLSPTPVPIKWYNTAARPGSSAVFGKDFKPFFTLRPDFMKGTDMKLLKKYSPQEEIGGIHVMCLWAIATA